MHRFSIRTILVLLVLAIAVPFAASLGWLTHLRIAERTDFALDMARGSASSARGLIDLIIAEAQGFAVRLATRDCAAVASFDVGPYAHLATIALVDRTGAVMCYSSRAAIATPASIERTPAFRQVAKSHGFAMDEPAEGPLTGRREVLLLQARFDAHGDWTGAAAVAIDLAGLEELLRRRLADPRDVIAVFSEDGRVIARSSDNAQFIGQAVALTPSMRAVREGHTQFYVGPNLDGRYRIGAFERVAATGWFVHSGLDRERVLASIYAQQTAAAIAFIAIVGSALLLGLWLSHRIARPITALAEGTAEPTGDAAPRVPVAGPREVAAVATRLNQAAAARFAAEQELNRSERFARYFLQYSTVVYARIRADGRYQIVNRQWRELFAKPGMDIENAKFGDFLPPEEASSRLELLDQVVRTGKPVTRALDASTNLGKRLLLSTFFPVLNEAHAVESVGIVGIDITDLRAAERERERLTAILMRMTEAVPVCLAYVDAEDRFIWTNSRNSDRLGLATDWIVGKTLKEVLGPRYADIEPVLATLRDGRTVRDELTWRAQDGTMQFYDRYVVPDLDENGRYRGHTMVLHDVTARKLAAEREHDNAERMRALSHRLIEAQEAERRAIARELHDEVGQSLTAVHATLQSLERQTTDPDQAARLIDNAASVNRVIGEIRNASMRLRPSVLDDLGLVPALRWLVQSQARAGGLDISLELESLSSDVPPEIATGCFRVAQEAITNAIRHARAQRVSVRLAEDAGRLTIEIADDGIGFDIGAALEKAAAGQGSGLAGMRERTDLLGGAFEVQAAPEGGTLVRASFPLTSTASERLLEHAT